MTTIHLIRSGRNFLFTCLAFALCFQSSLLVHAQGVAVSSAPSDPHPSSILDVSATDKGMLVPRMSQAQRESIVDPASGLIVYQTDGAMGLWHFNGSEWSPVGGGGVSSGSNEGDLLYWTGSDWAIVPVGLPGQHLILSAEGIPDWAGPIYPQLSTSSMSSVGATIAFGGGNVTNDGGSAVTARGLCWSTSPNPTLADNYTVNGTGTGTFSGTLTNLQLNTQYYVRAYATNAVGTGYGNQITFTTSATPLIAIGEPYAGGIIFYLDGSGVHGLVVTDTDQTSTQWGCYNTNVGGTSQAFGTGQSNTNAIISGCGTPGIAARVCNDLVYGGYSDWYLPSKAELQLVYQNLGANGIGGFLPDYYWASSQEHQWSSYFVRFSDGLVDYRQKDEVGPLRAIRNF